MRSVGNERLKKAAVDAWVRAPRSGQALSKLADGGGLYLVRLPSGSCTWQFRYRYQAGGRNLQRVFTIGPYATVGLAEARAAHAVAKAKLKDGIDPVVAQKVERATRIVSTSNTFGELVDDWLAKEQPTWSEVHYAKSARALERDVTPHLGALPVAEITPAMVAGVIERVQSRGVRETAAKILQHVNSIFRYAQAKGLRHDNPATAVSEVLAKPERVRRLPAITDLAQLGEVLRRAEVAEVSTSVRRAHRLLAYTAQRVANIVEARWQEFDLDGSPPLWTIPRDRMKVSAREFPHKVVLPPQLVAELKRWKSVRRDEEYLFPGSQGRTHVSREAIEKFLREKLDLRNRHCPHGWRSALSTNAHEVGGFDPEVIEFALDHIDDSKVARAYDRGDRLAKRVSLANWWGTQLELAERGIA